MHEAARDLEPPPHAAGKGFGLRVAPLYQVNSLKHFVDILLALGARNAVELGIDHQVFLEGEVLVTGQRLGNDTDHAAHIVRIFDHVVPSDDGFA